MKRLLTVLLFSAGLAFAQGPVGGGAGSNNTGALPSGVTSNGSNGLAVTGNVGAASISTSGQNAGQVTFGEASANGTNKVVVKAPDDLAADFTVTWGPATGTPPVGTPNADTVCIGDGTNWDCTKTLPSCSNSTSSKLLYNNSTHVFSCGTDQSGGGSSTNINSWIATATSSTSGLGATNTALHCSGIWLPNPGQFGNLMVQVQTADATHSATFCAYSADGSSRLFTTASTTLSSTGYANVALTNGPVSLSAGLINMCYVGAASSTLAFSSATNVMLAYTDTAVTGTCSSSSITVPTITYTFVPNGTNYKMPWYGLIP